MKKQALSDNEVIAEIKRLQDNPYVKLAKQVENKALRQRMYQLRSLEKRGRELASLMGIKVEENG